LSRVATAAERLDALKELVGNPYAVTTGRTIVLVEGPAAGSLSTDVRVLDRIHPSATRYTFIPMGARASVISAVRGLREQVSEHRFGLTILGLVDRDRRPPAEEGVISWPFATIENLLLIDSGAIADALHALGGPDRSPGQIDRLLKTAARAMRDEEVRVRVGDALKARTYRFGGVDPADVQASIRAAAENLAAEAADMAQLQRITSACAIAVDRELARGTYRRQFRGKQLLHGVLGLLALHNVPFGDFLYALAEACARSDQAQSEISAVFQQLDDTRSARIAAVVLPAAVA
jgi:hypothetical protein